MPIGTPTAFGASAGTVQSTAVSITLPVISTNSLGLLFMGANTGTISSPPAGWSLVFGPYTGPQGNEITYLYSKVLTAADSQTTISLTYSASARWNGIGLVIPGADIAVEQYAQTAPSTLLTQVPFPAITPSHDDDLLVSFFMTRSSSGTNSSTPSTGWTESSDFTTMFTTGANVGAKGGYKQLTGQNGVVQNDGYITINPQERVTGAVLTIAPAAGPVTLTPAGTPSAEASGTPVLAAGPVTLTPAGTASAEAAGTPVLAAGPVTLTPTGTATAEAAGAPVLVAGPVTLTPTGTASAEAAGVPVLAAGPVVFTPAGTATAEAAGTPSLAAGAVTLTPTGTVTAEAAGAPVLAAGPVVLTPAGTATAEAAGVPLLAAGGGGLTPTGTPSAEAAGTPTLIPGPVTLVSTGTPSAEAAGVPVLTGLLVLTPTGTATAEAAGAPVLVAGPVTLTPTGTVTAEAAGAPSLAAGALVLTPMGLATAEAAGVPALAAGPVTLVPTGTSSAEAGGLGVLVLGVAPEGHDITVVAVLGPRRSDGNLAGQVPASVTLGTRRAVAVLAARRTS